MPNRVQTSPLPFWVPMVWVWFQLVFSILKGFWAAPVQPYTLAYLIPADYLIDVAVAVFLIISYRSFPQNRKWVLAVGLFVLVDMVTTGISFKISLGHTSREVASIIEHYPQTKFFLCINLPVIVFESALALVGWSLCKLKPFWLEYKYLSPIQVLVSRFLGVSLIAYSIFQICMMLLYLKILPNI